MKPPDLGGFGIPKEDVDEFVRVFNENIEDYGLADDVQGTKYLRLDKLSPHVPIAIEAPSAEETGTEIGYKEIPTLPGSAPTGQIVPKQIFVAHGKNRRPIEQLERILTKFKVPHKIAIEELPAFSSLLQMKRPQTLKVRKFGGPAFLILTASFFFQFLGILLPL